MRTLKNLETTLIVLLVMTACFLTHNYGHGIHGKPIDVLLSSFFLGIIIGMIAFLLKIGKIISKSNVTDSSNTYCALGYVAACAMGGIFGGIFGSSAKYPVYLIGALLGSSTALRIAMNKKIDGAKICNFSMGLLSVLALGLYGLNYRWDVEASKNDGLLLRSVQIKDGVLCATEPSPLLDFLENCVIESDSGIIVPLAIIEKYYVDPGPEALDPKTGKDKYKKIAFNLPGNSVTICRYRLWRETKIPLAELGM